MRGVKGRVCDRALLLKERKMEISTTNARLFVDKGLNYYHCYMNDATQQTKAILIVLSSRNFILFIIF